MRFPLLSLLTLCGWLAVAQSPGDSSFVADARKNAIALYSKATGPQSHIYNGNSYIEYHQQEEEHPYFINEWMDGSITYENQYYENIPLIYDISNDKIITDHQYNVNKIQLISSKVSSFTLQQHRFVNLKAEGNPAGFYEVLYDGNTKAYVQWRKSLQETITNQAIERRFDDKSIYYIRKEGKMYSVKNKKSVLHLFPDRKSEIKKFIRANSVNFKADRAKAISQVVKFYDQSQP